MSGIAIVEPDNWYVITEYPRNPELTELTMQAEDMVIS